MTHSECVRGRDLPSLASMAESPKSVAASEDSDLIRKQKTLANVLFNHPIVVDVLASHTEVQDHEALVRALLTVAPPERALRLVKEATSIEFTKRKAEQGSILRGNSLCSKLTSTFCHGVARDYLKQLFVEPLRAIKSTPLLQIDEAQTTAQEARENCATLFGIADDLLQRMTDATFVAQMPRDLRDILAHIGNLASKHAPDRRLALIGGLIMLRVYNPTILAPVAYGVFEPSERPGAVMRKNLIMVTRLFQHAANDIKFKKNPHLALNAWLDANHSVVQQFLSQLGEPIAPKEGADGDNDKGDNDDALSTTQDPQSLHSDSEALDLIHKSVLKVKRVILKELQERAAEARAATAGASSGQPSGDTTTEPQTAVDAEAPDASGATSASEDAEGAGAAEVAPEPGNKSMEVLNAHTALEEALEAAGDPWGLLTAKDQIKGMVKLKLSNFLLAEQREQVEFRRSLEPCRFDRRSFLRSLLRNPNSSDGDNLHKLVTIVSALSHGRFGVPVQPKIGKKKNNLTFTVKQAVDWLVTSLALMTRAQGLVLVRHMVRREFITMAKAGKVGRRAQTAEHLVADDKREAHFAYETIMQWQQAVQVKQGGRNDAEARAAFQATLKGCHVSNCIDAGLCMSEMDQAQQSKADDGRTSSFSSASLWKAAPPSRTAWLIMLRVSCAMSDKDFGVPHHLHQPLNGEEGFQVTTRPHVADWLMDWLEFKEVNHMQTMVHLLCRDGFLEHVPDMRLGPPLLRLRRQHLDTWHKLYLVDGKSFPGMQGHRDSMDAAMLDGIGPDLSDLTEIELIGDPSFEGSGDGGTHMSVDAAVRSNGETDGGLFHTIRKRRKEKRTRTRRKSVGPEASLFIAPDVSLPRLDTATVATSEGEAIPRSVSQDGLAAAFRRRPSLTTLEFSKLKKQGCDDDVADANMPKVHRRSGDDPTGDTPTGGTAKPSSARSSREKPTLTRTKSVGDGVDALFSALTLGRRKGRSAAAAAAASPVNVVQNPLHNKGGAGPRGRTRGHRRYRSVGGVTEIRTSADAPEDKGEEVRVTNPLFAATGVSSGGKRGTRKSDDIAGGNGSSRRKFNRRSRTIASPGGDAVDKKASGRSRHPRSSGESASSDAGGADDGEAGGGAEVVCVNPLFGGPSHTTASNTSPDAARRAVRMTISGGSHPATEAERQQALQHEHQQQQQQQEAEPSGDSTGAASSDAAGKDDDTGSDKNPTPPPSPEPTPGKKKKKSFGILRTVKRAVRPKRKKKG